MNACVWRGEEGVRLWVITDRHPKALKRMIMHIPTQTP